MEKNMAKMLEAASNFRAYNDIPSGGIILFSNNEPYAWRDRVRNPETELPGVIALDESGNQWIAEGGDGYNGAERWTAMSSGCETEACCE